MKQKFTFLFLYLFCLLPLSVWGQSYEGTYVANGVTWKYWIHGWEGKNWITGETLGAANFSGPLNIPSSVVHDGVTYTVDGITNGAFQNYTHATTVTIPSSVVIIKFDAFRSSGIASVILPNTSSLKLGEHVFTLCKNLTNVTIPDNTLPENFGNNGSSDDSPFYACDGLESVIIPNSWTYIPEGLLQGCSKLSTVTIPANITKIGKEAFDGCKNLTNVDVSSTTNLEEIGDRAFRDCENLLLSPIPNSVKKIGFEAFLRCKKMSNPTFSNNLESIGKSAFANNESITRVVIPSSVSSLGEQAFSFCNSLTDVTLPSNMTIIPKELFSRCSNLVHCNLPDGLTSIGDEAFYECKLLSEDLSHLTHVTYFGGGSFYRCEKITGNLIFPNGTQVIGGGAFGGCKGVTGTLTFPSTLKTIGGAAFSQCTGLTGSLIFPDNLETIAYGAFFDCTGFTGNLTLGKNLRLVGDYAFKNTNFVGGTLRIAMQNVDGTKIGSDAFSDAKFSHVIVEGEKPVPIGAAFWGTQGASNVEYWDASLADNKYQITLTIAPDVKVLPDNAFFGLYVIGDVTIPASVTSVGKGAFCWCRKLNRVIWNGSATSIPDYCFTYSSIASISLPNTVTKIGDYAFSGCKKLTTFDFNSHITFIGDEAFNGCTELVADASTLLPSTITTLGSGAFLGCRKITGEAVLPSPYQTAHPEVQNQSIVNPVVGTGCYGIKMGPYTNFFQPSVDFNQNTNWQGGQFQTLLYIDARNCTIALTNVKNAANTCYQFSRSSDLYDEDIIYSNFANLAMNALVYLPSESVFQDAALPQKSFEDRFVFNTEYPERYQGSGENFIMDGKCQRFYVQDGLDYRVPYAFKAIEARCSRIFSNTTGKAVSTLYLPYPTDLPDGMIAYTLSFKGVDGNGDKAFHFEPLPVGTRLEANHPYLVQVTDGQSHRLPVMHDVDVPVSPDIENTAVMATGDSNWKIYGTTERINNNKAYEKKAYYLSQNKWWAVQDGVEEDFIAPFRCFITSPTGAIPAKGFVMVLHGGTADSINQLEKVTEDDIKSGRYDFYTIDGIRLGKDYDKLKSGQIYIINGKKFYKY